MATAVVALADDAPDWLSRPLKKPLKDLVIGVTENNVGTDGYQTTYHVSLNNYAKELGIRTIVLDAQGDPAKQIDQIRNLVAQRVDVIIVWPTNAKAVVPTVKQAHDAGMSIVVTNSEIDPSGLPYITAFSGPNTYHEGELAAKLLADALGDKGNVVVLNGVPGYATAILREKGFVDAITKDHPNIKILDRQPANWNRERGQAVMEDFLTKYGDQINGVYAANDNMGIGALNAIRAAGKTNQIKIVGATLFKDGYEAIKEGSYYGSVVQSPIIDAQNALQVAVRIAEGEKVPKVNNIETQPITQANLTQFQPPSF
jgi:ribose transport system substrate-binding protein